MWPLLRKALKTPTPLAHRVAAYVSIREISGGDHTEEALGHAQSAMDLDPNDPDAHLAMAEALARDSGAKIYIVHVEEPPTAYGGGEMYYGMLEPDLEQLKELLSKVKPADPQIDYEHHMITGEPADSIARFADENNIDIIVMGTHGRTGLMRLLMGSVAEVVRRAKCAVLTVKPASDDESE